MFWGCVVTEGKPYELPANSEYDLLHVSNAALSKASEAGKTYLMVTKGADTFTLGCLQKEKVESVFMDIFLRASQKVKFTVAGKGEVHVTGYFETTEGGEDLDDKMIEKLMQGEEDEEESEEAEEKPADKKPEPKKELKKEVPHKEAKKAEQIGGKSQEAEAEEDDEEGDLLGSDDDEDEEEVKKVVAAKKHPAGKPLPPPKGEKRIKQEKPEGGKQHKEAAGKKGGKKKDNK